MRYSKFQLDVFTLNPARKNTLFLFIFIYLFFKFKIIYSVNLLNKKKLIKFEDISIIICPICILKKNK